MQTKLAKYMQILNKTIKNIRDWKVDNGGVLFNKEVVLCESFDTED